MLGMQVWLGRFGAFGWMAAASDPDKIKMKRRWNCAAISTAARVGDGGGGNQGRDAPDQELMEMARC